MTERRSTPDVLYDEPSRGSKRHVLWLPLVANIMLFGMVVFFAVSVNNTKKELHEAIELGRSCRETTDQLNSQLATIQEALEKASRDNGLLKKTTDTLASERQQLQAYLDQARESIQQLELNISEAKAQLSQAIGREEMCRKNSQKCEAENLIAQKNFSDCFDEKEKVLARERVLIDDIKKCNEKILQVEKSIQIQANEFARVQKDVGRANEMIDLLTERLRSTKNDLEFVCRQVFANNKQLASQMPACQGSAPEKTPTMQNP